MSENNEPVPDDKWEKIVTPFGTMTVTVLKNNWSAQLPEPKQHRCPCCNRLLPPGVTIGEALLELYYKTSNMKHDGDFFVVTTPTDGSDVMKQVLAAKLADGMMRCGLGLVFRAIVEDWDQARINREVY